MKKLIIAAALILLAGVAFGQTTISMNMKKNAIEKIDIEKEKEAIKAIIENETNSNYAKNFDQQKKSFLQDESIFVISAGKGGYGGNGGSGNGQ